jgi:TRAP-type C4-dicarboxylate transport system substrate-binding protein
MTKRHIIGAAASVALLTSVAAESGAETIALNVSGLVSTHVHHTALEREFYETLGERTGLDIHVNFNPLDVIGVHMDDTLRLASDGTFDVVNSTIGNVARDEPLLEGQDLIGVSPTVEDYRAVVEAFRPVMQERVQERFGVKIMAIFPYGPQIFFCKEPIDGLADLSGKRVRSYTRTMSALIEHVGGTPVTMPFAEVYPSLQRGVVECAITSATSSNTGSWPEITTHVLPLGIAHGSNAIFMNLDTFNALSPEAQEALEEAYLWLEDALWDMSARMIDDALRCSTGQEPCEHYTPFSMTLVEPDEADYELLAEAVDAVVLDVFAEACTGTYPECVEVWNETVGKVRGFEMRPAS